MDGLRICLRGLLIAGVAALCLLAGGANQGAQAQGHNGLDPNVVGIDAVPDASNTKTTLGTIDRCVQVGGVGSTFNIDVFLDDVPCIDNVPKGSCDHATRHNLGGFEYRLNYDNTKLKVNTTAHNYLMNQTGAISDNGDCSAMGSPCPDTDGSLFTSVVGLGGEASAEPRGSLGVLSRLQMEVVGGSGTPVYLTLTNLKFAGYEPGATPWWGEIDEVWDATIAINTACPTPADVEIVSQSMLVDLPPTINVNTAHDVTLHKTIRNNGPTDPVDVDITTDVTAPGDCTVTPDPSNPTSWIGLTGAPVDIDEVYTISCSQASAHSFTFDNEIDLTTPDTFDPSPANNTASTQTDTDVLAEADLDVSGGVTVDAPEDATGAFPVSVNAGRHQ